MSFSFEVDKSSDLPLWVQLRQRIIYLIDSKYFKPGDQLPTVRALATKISINYNTVNKAYLSLASDGYIESTRGRGAFVRGIDSEAGSDFPSEAGNILDDSIAACRDLGLSLDDIGRLMSRKILQIKKVEEGAKDSETTPGNIVDFTQARKDVTSKIRTS